MNGYAKGLLAAVTSAALLSGCGEKQVTGGKPVASKPMHSVINELDLDGEMLVYMDGKSVSEDLSKTLNEFADTMPSQLGSKVKLADEALKWAGVYDINSIAYSAKMTDAPMMDLVEILEMKSHWKEHALWSIFSGQSEMKSRRFAPGTTVLYEAWNMDISALWANALEGVGRFGDESLRTMMEQQMVQAAAMLGIDPLELMDSLSGEQFIWIALNDSNKVQLPIPGLTEQIGAPSAMMGFALKSDDFVAELVAAMKNSGAPLTEERVNDLTIHTVTMPPQAEMPFDVSPSLAVVDGYLLIASSKAAIVQAAADAKSGEGMIAGDNWRNWMGDCPEKMNFVAFVEPSFMSQYIALITNAVSAQMPQGGSPGAIHVTMQPAAMMAMQLSMYKDMYGAGYSTTDGDRIVVKGSYSMGGYTMPSYAVQSVIRSFGAQATSLAPLLTK